MSKLYFINGRGEEKLLAETENEDVVNTVIKDFLAEKKYESYYTRTWIENGVKTYDIGSHTEFFEWRDE